MRQVMKLLFAPALVLSMGTAGCATSWYPRIDLKDLPHTHYDVTRYTSATKSSAIILDDPNDDVLLTVAKEKSRTKREGLSTPQEYVKDFLWSPNAYRLLDKETGNVLGYLLISPELKWRASYNKAKGKVSIWIDDPYDCDR
jgi:hypothetical protein